MNSANYYILSTRGTYNRLLLNLIRDFSNEVNTLEIDILVFLLGVN
jgi:hypothetical protein